MYKRVEHGGINAHLISFAGKRQGTYKEGICNYYMVEEVMSKKQCAPCKNPSMKNQLPYTHVHSIKHLHCFACLLLQSPPALLSQTKTL